MKMPAALDHHALLQPLGGNAERIGAAVAKDKIGRRWKSSNVREAVEGAHRANKGDES